MSRPSLPEVSSARPAPDGARAEDPPPVPLASTDGAPVPVTYARSRRDVLRLAGAVVITLVCVGIVLVAGDAVLALEADIVSLVDGLTPTVERLLHGLAEWLASVAVIGVLVFRSSPAGGLCSAPSWPPMSWPPSPPRWCPPPWIGAPRPS